jgi:hypothetical protein
MNNLCNFNAKLNGRKREDSTETSSTDLCNEIIYTLKRKLMPEISNLNFHKVYSRSKVEVADDAELIIISLRDDKANFHVHAKSKQQIGEINPIF